MIGGKPMPALRGGEGACGIDDSTNMQEDRHEQSILEWEQAIKEKGGGERNERWA